jgi:ketosteroid isomerase-like protein
MAEHPNALRIRELFAAFRAGDVAAIDAALAADVVWRFPGRRGKLAGEHRGKDQIFSFLMNVQALTGGTFHLDLADVAASDEYAVAIFRGHGEREGRHLDNPTALVIRFSGDKIAELREFVWDLEHVEDFWS